MKNRRNFRKLMKAIKRYRLNPIKENLAIVESLQGKLLEELDARDSLDNIRMYYLYSRWIPEDDNIKTISVK